MKTFVVGLIGMALLSAGAPFVQVGKDGKDANDAAKLVAEGKKLYERYECSKCHMIAGHGNKISPLDGVATKLSEADIRKWLTNTLEMETKLDRKPKVKMSAKKIRLTPRELDALTAYLGTLK